MLRIKRFKHDNRILFDYLLINMTIPTHKYHVLQWKGYIKVLCNMYVYICEHTYFYGY